MSSQAEPQTPETQETGDLATTDESLEATLAREFDEAEAAEETADEQGKTPQATPAETPAVEDQGPAGEAQGAEASPPGDGDAGTTEDLGAPQHWKPEDRDAFIGLDDPSKHLVLAQSKRMEAAHQKRVEEVKAEGENLINYVN